LAAVSDKWGYINLDKIFILIDKRKRSEKEVAGIVAICNLGAEKDNANVIYYLAHSMLMLQHRGKAYWQMAVGNGMAGREGSFPSDDNLLKIARQEKL
jgi:amidophosphoribosyltransferase